MCKYRGSYIKTVPYAQKLKFRTKKKYKENERKKYV